jgi:hypothetical protein
MSQYNDSDVYFTNCVTSSDCQHPNGTNLTIDIFDRIEKFATIITPFCNGIREEQNFTKMTEFGENFFEFFFEVI